MAGGWFRPRCRGAAVAAGRGGYRSQSPTDQRKQNTASDIHRHRRASHRGVAGAGRPKTGTRLDPREPSCLGRRVPGVPDLALLDRRRDPQRCGPPPGRTGEFRDPDWLAARRRRRRQPARHRADDRHRARCQPKLAVLLFTQLQTEGWAADAQAHAPRLRPRRPVDADAAPVRGAVPEDLGLATMACRGRRRTRRTQAGRRRSRAARRRPRTERPRLASPGAPGSPHHRSPARRRITTAGLTSEQPMTAAGPPPGHPGPTSTARSAGTAGKPCPAQGRAHMEGRRR
jgi:hypothetical protein